MLGGKQEAGMDSVILVFATFLASMLVVGYLAHERGWRQARWVWIAAAIGPLAIPLLYLVDAASALRKRMNARRT
jgi:MFS family permease